MRLLQLVCCCSSILAVTSGVTVDGYTCVSAYWDTIACVLNIAGNPVGQSNATYSLKFTENRSSTTCPLVVGTRGYSCVCKVSDTFFFFASEYLIELCHESGCQTVTKSFMPSLNIQLTPPHDVEFQQTSETTNIIWKSGYEKRKGFDSIFIYQLLLQTSQDTESKSISPTSYKSASFQRSYLKPGAKYCVKVRSFPNDSDYNGTWSAWSPLSCCENGAGQDQDNLLIILTKSLGPLCLAVGVLLCVFYSPAARMKIKTLSHTPSPAPFFQPLFQQHEGNLQEWFSPRGKCVLTHRTEEILTTGAVTVVPKPITNEPEAHEDPHDPPAAPLLFTRCHSSYVCPQEASPPVAAPGPQDAPYTRLPGSVWGAAMGRVEAAPPPPKRSLDTSQADSGCSCEELTHSPDCSGASSPVEDRAPPCHCNDYCILNKTAGGFSPVLVSKGSGPSGPPVSLQEEKS